MGAARCTSPVSASVQCRRRVTGCDGTDIYHVRPMPRRSVCQIYGERACEEAVANPNFMAEQRVIYDAFHAQATAHQEAAAV
jgi:hypothetical protein